MTLNEYQVKAARTMNKEINGGDTFMHGLFGIVSEIGEITGIIQKYYQGHKIDWDHFIEEMGDALWMLAEICTSIGADLEDVAERNIKKLLERYPDGFDPNRSIFREEVLEDD